MSESDNIDALAVSLTGELIIAGKSVATAESCTGGWIAKALTDISGSSQCFGYGIVSYSNGAKESMLGVNSGCSIRLGQKMKVCIDSVNVPGRQLNVSPTEPLIKKSTRKKKTKTIKRTKTRRTKGTRSRSRKR